jgi:hypothetical protein
VSVRTSAGLAASAAVVFQPTTVTATTASATAKVVLYPNPATTSVHLPGLPAGTQVQLLDGLGRSVRTTSLTHEMKVSVEGLAPGLYNLHATDAKGSHYAARLVVQ